MTDEEIFYAHDGKHREGDQCQMNLNLLGRHNYENVMAATAMQCEFRSADGENRGGAEAFTRL